MKIGLINNFGNYPPRGGSSLHVYQQISKFIEKGHEVHSFFGNYPFDNFVKYKKGELKKFANNIDILYLRLGGGVRQDIISLAKYLSYKKIPLVWEVNALASERGGLKKYLVEFAWKILSFHVDGVISVSNVVDKYVRKILYAKNHIVVPNGSDPELFNPLKTDRNLFSGINPDDFVVLWAGSAEFPWQGVDILFETARRMKNLEDHVKFVLITDPESLQQNLLPNMRVIKKVPYFEIGKYIASSDLCLCLYKINEESKFGFYNSPLKLFDYMSCAKPIIASPLGQISEIIKDGENGCITDNNVDNIVSSILKLKKNNELCIQMGNKARQEVIDYYNWNRVAEESIELFERCIKQRNLKC